MKKNFSNFLAVTVIAGDSFKLSWRSFGFSGKARAGSQKDCGF